MCVVFTAEAFDCHNKDSNDTYTEEQFTCFQMIPAFSVKYASFYFKIINVAFQFDTFGHDF